MTRSKKHKTALHEKEGVSSPEITDSKSISKLKHKRSSQPEAQELIEGVLNGDITALSRAITLIESKSSRHINKASAIIKACLPRADRSVRIGITGVPGVGKSTFIETFGKHLMAMGKKVAVLAVDPSSSITKGSILGDKTRMEDLVRDHNAFIRPSASGDTLGGRSAKNP